MTETGWHATQAVPYWADASRRHNEGMRDIRFVHISALGSVLWGGGVIALALCYHHFPRAADIYWRTVAGREALLYGVAWPVSLFIMCGAVALASAWIGHVLLCRERSVRTILLLVLVVGVLFAVTFPPILSSDVFGYADLGFSVDRGVNPYVTPPGSQPFTPVRSFDFWPDYVAPYGPLWLGVSALLTPLGGGHPRLIALMFQLFGLGALIGAAALAGHVRGPRAAAAIATNPLLLIECVGSGHVDAFVLTLLIVAVILYTHRRLRAAAAMIAVAAACKIVPLLLIPLLIAHAQTWRIRLGIVGAVAAVLMVAYAPFLIVDRSLAPFRSIGTEAASDITNPLWTRPVRLLAGVTHASVNSMAVLCTLGADVLILGCVLAVSWFIWRDRRRDVYAVGRGLIGWAIVFIAFATLLMQSKPWYWVLAGGMVAVLPLNACVVPPLRWGIAAVTFLLSVSYVIVK